MTRDNFTYLIIGLTGGSILGLFFMEATLQAKDNPGLLLAVCIALGLLIAWIIADQTKQRKG